MPPGNPKRPRRYERKHKPIFAPTPRPFDFGFTAMRPLVPMPAIAMFLNQKPREVMELIENGQLRWAFDIRHPDVERREVRVLRQSLFEFTGLYAPPTKSRRDEAAELAAVIETFLPRGTVMKAIGSASPGDQAARAFQIKLRLAANAAGQTLIPREPILRGTEIAQCFSCLSQHVLNLVKAKAFTEVNLRRGLKASPLVTRASVLEFLKQRRMS
jgi:hypothetical protein